MEPEALTGPDPGNRAAAPLGEARCREILEVGPEASPEEIYRSYAFLKELYGPGPQAAFAPSMDEFSPGAKAAVLREVEAAFEELRRTLAPPAPARSRAPLATPEPDRILAGPDLRRIRESRGLTLEDLALETSVRLAFLEALEEERFGDLPGPPVIVRGYLTAYLSALGITSEGSVADYLRRARGGRGI